MKKIINVQTGEIIERELNPEELAQQKIDLLETQSREQTAANEEAAKTSAINKLNELGLTVEDLKALGL
jgi:hypothetical protein